MKKLLVLFTICIMLLSATPAFAETLTYNAPKAITVDKGISTLSIEVQAGNLEYAALRFQLALPDDVTITDISYAAAGNYSAMGPNKMPELSNEYAGLTIFGITSEANTIRGNVTCTLKLSYTGSTNQTITIKEIKQSIITGQQTSNYNTGASSDVRLIADSGTSDPAVLYNITAASVTGGSITVTPPASRPSRQAAENDTVSISFSANSGYTFDSWTVSGSNGQSVAINSASSASTSFKMPAFDVAVKATVTRVSTNTYTISGKITGSDAPNGLAATLQLRNSSGTSIGASVKAAADGTYTITNVPAGTGYTIYVTMVGYNGGTITSFNVSNNVTGKNLTLTKTTTPTTPTTPITPTNGTGGGGGGGGGGNPTTVTITDLDVPTGSIRFSDVTENHWAYEFIEYLAGRGFVNGKTATTFGPSDNITRAEFVTILARMSGDTLPAYSGTFSDVAATAYYAQAVAWAVQAGVTQGTSATTFSPNNRITRQDIATMLVRYANYKNITFAPINAAVTFADDAQISSYAKEPVSTMQRAGVISGNTDGTFRPLNNATRAEASKMLALVHNAMSK